MLKVLIIGCGAIAGGYDARHGGREGIFTHAAAYRQDGHFRLAACVDPDATRRQAFRATWAVERDDPTIEQALATGTRFDIVSICSPTTQHGADLDQVLAARPALIFCEKPLAPTLAEAKHMVAACREAGVALAVNHTRRWDPAVAALRQELDAGRWGAVRAAVGVYNKGLLNNGSHMIDLLHLLLGPLRLIAVGRANADYAADDPSVPALLESTADASVQLVPTQAADYACFELQLLAQHGAVALEDGGLAWRRRQVMDSPYFPGYRLLDAGIRQPGRLGEAMTRAVANLRDHVRSGAPLASTGDSALAAQALCDEIRRRALTGDVDNQEAIAGPGDQGLGEGAIGGQRMGCGQGEGGVREVERLYT